MRKRSREARSPFSGTGRAWALRRALIAGALLVAVVGCRTRQTAPAGEPADDSAAAETPAPAADDTAATEEAPVQIVYPSSPGSFVDLIDEVAPSVVHIKSATPVKHGPAALVPGGGPSHALGSGFVVDNAGHVLTNDHVVARAGELRVVLASGVELPARVIGRDEKLDIALLVVDGSPAELSPARLGDARELRTGEWVVALGNPFGSEVTAAAGIVSATGRARGGGAGQRVAYGDFLRTDAAIDASNSGGPLVDTAGQVVGISTAVDERGARGGFAVPIDLAKQVLPMLEEEGRVTRAWLGVFVHPVSAEDARARGLEGPTGALVSDVVAGSPAARAGVRAGDVILRFDGDEVDERSLPWRAATAGIGRRVPLVVWRSGEPRELELTTEKMPE